MINHSIIPIKVLERAKAGSIVFDCSRGKRIHDVFRKEIREKLPENAQVDFIGRFIIVDIEDLYPCDSNIYTLRNYLECNYSKEAGSSLSLKVVFGVQK